MFQVSKSCLETVFIHVSAGAVVEYIKSFKNQAKSYSAYLSFLSMRGTKVTYAIGYTNVSALQHEIRNMRLKIKRLKVEGNEISSARLAIKCAELLIEYADQPDSDLNEEQQEEHREENLNKAIRHCKTGYNILSECNKPYQDTIKALELMTDAYRRYIDCISNVTCHSLIMIH